jgi:ketosteroid isomerase-like protein
MEIWELVAREEIRSCIVRYNANGDAGRLEQMLDVFTDDAVMEIEGEQTVGRDAIGAVMRSAGREFVGFAKASGAPRDLPVLRHFTSTVDIEVVSPTEAHGSMYYFVFMHNGLDHWGRYLDDYRCDDGRWRIAHRREWMDGATAGGFGERTLSARRAAVAAPTA